VWSLECCWDVLSVYGKLAAILLGCSVLLLGCCCAVTRVSMLFCVVASALLCSC